jgi:hypothetical protein
MTAGPQRTCLGCRQVRPKAIMIRLVRGSDGRVEMDRAGHATGRGAYVCPVVDCLASAFKGPRLGRAFRRPSQPPVPNVEAILEAWLGAEAARKRRGER